MQFKKVHATLLLSSIILISTFYQKIRYTNTQHKMYQNSLEQTSTILPDTSNAKILSKTNQDFGKNWMQRYKKGIRFEYYPPN